MFAMCYRSARTRTNATVLGSGVIRVYLEYRGLKERRDSQVISDRMDLPGPKARRGQGESQDLQERRATE